MKTAVRLLSCVSLMALVACNGGGGGSGSGRSVKAYLLDAPVDGVEYVNPDGVRDITYNGGGFYCNPGKSVQFFIGGINLGQVTCVENAKVYPMDLISEPGVTKNNFDSSSTSAKISLFLLTLNFEKPESYDAMNFGPSTISVGMPYRSLLDGVSKSVFNNDASTLAFINKLRCNVFSSHLLDLYPPDENGAVWELPTPADFESCNDNTHDLNLAGLQDALEGAVIHMEKTIMVHSGIVANPGSNLYAQTVGDNGSGGNNGSGQNQNDVPVASLSEIASYIRVVGSNGTFHHNGVTVIGKCHDFSEQHLYLYTGNEGFISATVRACTDNDTDIVSVKRNGLSGSGHDTNLIFAWDIEGTIVNSGVIDLPYQAIGSHQSGGTTTVYHYQELKGSFFKVGNDVHWYQTCNGNHNNFWNSTSSQLSEGFVTGTCDAIQSLAWNLQP